MLLEGIRIRLAQGLTQDFGRESGELEKIGETWKKWHKLGKLAKKIEEKNGINIQYFLNWFR